MHDALRRSSALRLGGTRHVTASVANRVSANAMLAMAVGLVLLYHAGPWPWATHTLSVLGSALPLWVLGWPDEHKPMWIAPWMASWVVGTLALYTMTASLLDWHALATYAWSFVMAQALMTLVWLGWADELVNSWVAWLATALAAIGTCIAAYVHLWLPDPRPLPMWAWLPGGDWGSSDAVSAIAGWLLVPEAAMFWIAVAVWLWIVARPWLSARL